MNNFIEFPLAELLPDGGPVVHSIYSTRIGVKVDWPFEVEYKGKTYYWYDKLAIDNKTRQPCACYRYGDDQIDSRIWLRCDGQITED